MTKVLEPFSKYNILMVLVFLSCSQMANALTLNPFQQKKPSILFIVTDDQGYQDIYTTLLEMAGSAPKKTIEGHSFFQKIISSKQVVDANRSFYFIRKEGGARYGGQPLYAIRKGNGKLLQNSPYEGYELYNLKVDPMEQNNLIEEEHEKYKALNSLLMAHIQERGRVSWQRPSH